MAEPKRRLKGEQRRELIVDAARALFTERAYDEVSIGDIASRAGVSRTVMYDHFPSKQALVQSFLMEEMSALLAALTDQVLSEGSTRDRFIAVLRTYFAFLSERPLAFRMLALDSRTDADIAKAGRDLRDLSDQALGAALAADAERAGINVDSSHRTISVVMLTSAIRGLSEWWFENPEISSSELADAAFELLWGGVRSIAE
ncbi:MAG: TetR/AcrR family transcriptional regulator [Nocardiaceae bacterium]|nr:TetR/AcrR family transcriptional regulator [Nocardiaceae bacterium]